MKIKNRETKAKKKKKPKILYTQNDKYIFIIRQVKIKYAAEKCAQL